MVPSTKTTFVSSCTNSVVILRYETICRAHMETALFGDKVWSVFTWRRRPYWCLKTLKRRPCWCPKPIFWELNSLLGPSPFQGCPVINSVFGRLCKKTVPRGREDTRVWYRETMFSQVVSYDFPMHGLLHEYFLYLVSAPRNPEGIANLKKAICVFRSDSIIGVTQESHYKFCHCSSLF